MTEPDSPSDPDGGVNADVSDSAGPERGAAGSRESTAETDRRAIPRLADDPDTEDGDGDRSVEDPGAPREPDPIEPEPLRPENALFVLLGALGTVALLATAIVPGLL